ncbi:ligand-binding sensor domain-containing protein [Hwangdonia lutea]|uniref:Two-component regulator propeller domain-containing protein n=1 Tax=Hwangdonia lutea TaxID=3075823 RepID=A0AA97EQQ0_9FLAO|nr:two-component regulator propeller domain-containing protein [Hwangdonia sp. SCSIO 19198]WOD44914.1 two-component regulator propeller domain-containing protein [Hwangdonia sp. SCSIO 19198]
MRISILLCFFTLFTIVSIKLYAQNVSLQFQSITFEDGISDSRINHVLQDKEGFLWFATRLGIDSYNGQTIKTYQFLQEKQAEINTIIEGKEGHIWAATTKGLYFLNTEKDNFELFKSQDSFLNTQLESNIHSIIQLQNGRFLCSSASGNIFSMAIKDNGNNTNHIIFNFDGGSYSNYATTLFQDTNGVIWMGTSQGHLWVYNESEFVSSGFSKFNNTAYINDITSDSDGNLWIATNGNGLFSYNIDLEQAKHYKKTNTQNSKSINNNMVLSLYADKNDNIWIGTDGGGLNLYKKAKNKFHYFQSDGYNEFSISDNAILDISPGEDNVIWTGTVHGGASYFKNNINLYNVPPTKLGMDHRDKQDSRILEAKNGDLWITAGRNGLRRFNPLTHKVTVFKDDPNDDNDLSGNNILSLYEDGLGRIWIGTLYGGLNIFDPKTNQFLKAEKRSSLKAIFAIEKDGKDNIWVGSNSGITVYDSHLNILNTYSVNSKLGLSSNVITCLYRDIKDDMWVGTATGLNVFKQGKFTSYLPIKGDKTSLSGSRILSIAEDDDLSILVGTYGYGLNRYVRSADNFIRIDKENGLDATFIRGILLDDEKNIWCSTNLGLSKISPDGIVQNFDSHDGIQPFNNNKAEFGSDGFIYMAGNFGLTYFKAKDLKHNYSKNPNVFFTSISLINENGIEQVLFKNNLENNKLTLPKDNVVFTVGFATSNYWDPEKITYAYKLEGLHEQWQTVGNHQTIYFSNLNPGDYTLNVKAINNAGNESSHIASLNISALPSFWEKIWVKTLMFLFFIAIVIGFFKWRVLAIKRQKQKLEHRVNQKTRLVEEQNKKIYQNNLDLLNAEKANQELKQKQLENELNFKTDELTNRTLREIHKNNLLDKIRNDISKVAKQNEDSERLKSIVNVIDDTLNLDKDWDDFYSLFQQVQPTFISNIKKVCPNITDRDVRLCALIRLNFSSQHIATLFGISESSIKVARHRLRKKLKIEENQSFQEFFDNLIAKTVT